MLAHGGTLTTAGGVAFTAATLDDRIRGYDTQTGEVLWTTKLPAGGQAYPDDVSRPGRPAIRGDRGGRLRRARHHAGRLGHRLPARVEPSAPPAGAEGAAESAKAPAFRPGRGRSRP
ncbi:hypothetical protein ACU4GA_26065 [Methylobacterium oryzae CBMB20]